jgi:hypothetical protein
VATASPLAEAILAASFGEQLLLTIAGPLVAALAGSLGVGVALNIWTARRARENAVRELRTTLIADMTEIVGRARAAGVVVLRGRAMGIDSEHRTTLTRDLVAHYRQFFADAAIIEAKLGTYFPGSAVAQHWHATADCLRLSYYLVLEASPTTLAEMRAVFEVGAPAHEYSGLGEATFPDRDPRRHSGLGPDQLNEILGKEVNHALMDLDRQQLKELQKAIEGVKNDDIAPPRGNQRR